MKFNCDYRDRVRNWHDWFAWYPVKISEGDCRWLETIEVRADVSGSGRYIWGWSYRAKANG